MAIAALHVLLNCDEVKPFLTPRGRIHKDHTIENPYQDTHPLVATVMDNDPIGFLVDSSGVFEEIDDHELGRSAMPPHFIPPLSDSSTSTTFIPTIGMQEIPYNYFVQENTGVVRGQNPLSKSSGASNRASVASTNGDSTCIPNERNTTKKFLRPCGLE
ncbi:hypothetical protein ACH5RR_033830 [Cinchona calisaya]|uniref:Uncharacterized protein n=1 Tax=Cinchona calisaya TaxID=153742 RepID=A0ABD2YCX9_9GENT